MKMDDTPNPAFKHYRVSNIPVAPTVADAPMPPAMEPDMLSRLGEMMRAEADARRSEEMARQQVRISAARNEGWLRRWRYR